MVLSQEVNFSDLCFRKIPLKIVRWPGGRSIFI